MIAAVSTNLRRTLTATPLARMHERTLLGHVSRRYKPVTFQRFDRARYPQAALTIALDAQKALARGEYGAVDLFARIASELARHGAPFDVLSAAARIPSDEIRHADLTIRMAGALAGHAIELEGGLACRNRRADPVPDAVALDIVMTEVSAIGETLACALLSECRRGAVDPVVRSVLSSIVADEVHHARLGWYYLVWRAPQWTRADRQRVADRAGAAVMGVERRFWRGRDAPAGAEAAARALGVLDTERQRRVVRAVMEDEIVPALDALGLGASHAWRVRRRGN